VADPANSADSTRAGVREGKIRQPLADRAGLVYIPRFFRPAEVSMRRFVYLAFATGLAFAFGIACGSHPQTSGNQPPATQTASSQPASNPAAMAANKLKHTAKPPTAPPITIGTALMSVPPSGPGVDPTMMDKTADPCNDFYQYACGGWLAKTQIPAEYPAYGPFLVVHEKNEAVLQQVLTDDAAGKPDADDPYAKMAGDFWTACNDEATIEKLGTKPLTDALAAALAVKDVPTLEKAIAYYQGRGGNVLFSLLAEQDSKDATQEIAGFDQGGLGLPDRDYYLNTDKESQAVLAAYTAHVQKMLELSGVSPKDSPDMTKKVIGLETQLAKVSMTKVEQRDPVKTYNRINLKGLQGLSPTFPWSDLLSDLGYSGMAGSIDVKSVQFFKGIDPIIKSTTPDVWQAYLRYHLTAQLAPSLSKAFVDEDFAFSSTLTGVQTIRPRWKRCVDTTNSLIGMAPARSYVTKMFGQDGKDRSKAQILMIEEAMGQDIVGLSWMDDETKDKALEKLSMVENQIGFPDKWRSYDGLSMDPKAYAADVLAAEAFEVNRQLGKVGKPVDRTDWDMTPPTVNAYYDPAMNHMVFPAGILQPPFYDKDGTLAFNFGGIGMVMGHELTHGFDDQGSQFDGHGNLNNWWSKDSGDKFKGLGSCISKQYSGYVIAGDHLNGDLTEGENIADNGGIKISYEAFETAQKQTKTAAGKDPNGFSPEQQYFLAFGQSWCEKERDQFAQLMVKVDPHSPAQYRVNGPLSNLPAFQEAFSCKDGSAMAPTNRCEVW
jgi:putative endopeptidase